jgi:hypothetical protein
MIAKLSNAGKAKTAIKAVYGNLKTPSSHKKSDRIFYV